MPIVLNGSGTISGISVGGLPDGCVDADTLASGLATQGITMVDHWRLSADTADGAEAVITNWNQVSTANHQPGRIGSSMSVSSGVFTFPSTGWYYVHYSHDFRTSSDVNWVYMGLELTNDSGSNWTNLSYAAGNNGYGDGDNRDCDGDM